MKIGWTAPLALALIASPGAAATDFRGGEPAAARTGLFAGATLRIGLDRRADRPAARLVAGSYRLTDLAGARLATRPAGLELGLTRASAPLLSFGGQPMADVQRRLGLNGSTGTLLLIGGAVALGVVALVVLSDDNDDCCLDPNLCAPCDD
jgi:hypothetical protein